MRVDYEIDGVAAAEYRRHGHWRDAIIVDDFLGQSRRLADKVAIVSYRAEAARRDELTYSELATYVDRFAGGLLELGVEPGEVVSFQLPNWWEFVALQLACARVGAVANPILPILRRREVSFIVERTQSRICVGMATQRNFDHARLLLDVQADVPSLEHVFIVDGPAPAGTTSLDRKSTRLNSSHT